MLMENNDPAVRKRLLKKADSLEKFFDKFDKREYSLRKWWINNNDSFNEYFKRRSSFVPKSDHGR